MRLQRALWIVAGVVTTAAAVPLLATFIWDSRSAALRVELDRQARPEGHRGAVSSPDLYSAADLLADELPAPVERFFRHVLRDRQPIVRAVNLVTEGEMRTDDGAWRPFIAQQRFSTTPPGFVWDARIRMAPLLPVYVRDAYVGNHTQMRGRVLGVIPVVNEADTPGLAAGQLMRYLAETIWFPTALLPRHNAVTWQPIDEQHAIATLTDRGRLVALRFRFTPDGDVDEVFSPGRMREVDGAYVPTAWAVTCSDFQSRDGVRIPMACVAEWRRIEGSLPYWRGRVASIRYD